MFSFLTLPGFYELSTQFIIKWIEYGIPSRYDKEDVQIQFFNLLFLDVDVVVGGSSLGSGITTSSFVTLGTAKCDANLYRLSNTIDARRPGRLFSYRRIAVLYVRTVYAYKS